MTAITAYKMNPKEDEILFGDEIREGMWVMPEHPMLRSRGDSEDAQIRGQRFRRVIRIRQCPAQMAIMLEWVDGYRETWTGAVTNTWIVRREDALSADAELREIAGPSAD